MKIEEWERSMRVLMIFPSEGCGGLGDVILTRTKDMRDDLSLEIGLIVQGVRCEVPEGV